MKLPAKFHTKRGFTLVEMLIVVALLAVLVTLGVVFINPQRIYGAGYDANAEAIAVAAQSRLTELKNAGGLGGLQTVGEGAVAEGEGLADAERGGYRYLFSYTVGEDGAAVHNADMDILLPFGAVESEAAEGCFAIGFQADSATVGEVFWRERPFEAYSVSHLQLLSSDAELRARDEVGYWGAAEKNGGEVALARLPVPQINIENGETLSLSVYLPESEALKKQGKEVAIRVSLADADGKAYAGERNADGTVMREPLSLDDTAIYRTYSYGGRPFDQSAYGIETGVRYRLILDTPDPAYGEDLVPERYLAQNGRPSAEPPEGKFAAWAKRSAAFGDYFLLGDNMRVTVTVFCLTDDLSGVDLTYMPRSGSVAFNGWFASYDGGDTVAVSCGRHLQNLGKLTEPDEKIAALLPAYDADWNYTGKTENGSAYRGTEGSADEKYLRRADVQKRITCARQVSAIDFDRPEWKNGEGRIPFAPVNLPAGFTYFGNLLPISHLYAEGPYDAGLFGYACRIAVYDVRLAKPHVLSRLPASFAESFGVGAGALIGTSKNARAIANCQVFLGAEGSGDAALFRVAAEGYAGGLIGLSAGDNVVQSSASVYTGNADGSTRYAGGLIGRMEGGSVADCYAAGLLSGVRAGGLVGLVAEGEGASGGVCRIGASYSAGHIEFAQTGAAGLAGEISLTGTALAIEGNYCAVIYGRESEAWDGGVPVYGTFEGDGSLWLLPAEGGSGCAVADGKNYFFPQIGVGYADSAYLQGIRGAAETFREDLISASSDGAALTRAAEAFLEAAGGDGSERLGAEGVAGRLLAALGAGSGAQAAADDSIAALGQVLGEGWEGHDSGRRIYSAAELRALCSAEGDGGNAIHTDFVCDYAEVAEYAGSAQSLLKDPTYGDGTAGDGGGGHYYVDSDHGVYNNVVPYSERGTETKFYCYLMLRGRGVARADGEAEAEGVLTHYGDWLTASLICPDPAGHNYHTEPAGGEEAP